MGLRLYNTLHRKTEEFIPSGDTVRIYSCGLTVQGPPHLGHMRAYIIRDVLVRWLEHKGYKIKTLENFTDIDDKIIKKQTELKKDWRIIAEENISKYLKACDTLNIKRADFYPRASQHIEEIIGLVQRLIDKGFAYEKGGDVYFRVRRFSEYGRLSGKSIDELIAGARIEPTEHKEDPLDFALWKAAKPGEPYWFSPWSKGRPGWHIECSAMSMHYLGETFDIHMGGEDLIFPHHENEIAQSVAATGKEFARFWIHNGWVTLGGEKMAKSTGHYFLIEDLLKEYNPNVIRLYLLKTQYRNQLEFSEERLKEAKAAYLRIQTYIQGFNDLPDIDTPLMFEEFSKAMDDDLNTPKALGVIYDLITKGYEEGGQDIGASVRRYLDILGFKRDKIEEPFAEVMQLFREVCARIEKENQRELLEQIKDDFWGGLDKFQGPDFVFPMVVNLLLKIRNIFRKEKKYEFADYIRKRLAEHHIQIQDKGMEITTYRLEAK